MTKSFTLHGSKGLGFHLASKSLEWREKRRNGSARSLLQWPAMKRLGRLQGWHCRSGRSQETAAVRARERGREEHGHQRRLGEKERVGSGAREGISRRKRAPQPSQNWLKTAQFSESGTAGHYERHCRTANFAGITLKLYDLLYLRYGYIYYLNIMTSKQSTILTMVMTLSWCFEMVLKHNIYLFKSFSYVARLSNWGVPYFKPCYENQVYLAHYVKHKTLT